MQSLTQNPEPKTQNLPLAPATLLVPLLNLGLASDMLQLAATLARDDRRPTTNGDLSSSIVHRPSFASSGPPVGPRIVVLSVVEVPEGQPLTMGLDMARSYRALLDFLPSGVDIGGRHARVDRVVKVARNVAEAVHQAAREELADMVLLHWKGYAREPKRHVYGRISDATLKNPPCSVMLARLEGWSQSRRVLLPVRGGPTAEQALDLGMAFAERMRVPLTVLHNVPQTTTDDRRPTTDDRRPVAVRRPPSVELSQVESLGEEPYIIFNEHLRRVQEWATVPVESILTRLPNPAEALLGEARGDDLVIMGLPAPRREQGGASASSSVVSRVSAEKGSPLLLLNTPASIDLAAYTRQVRAGRSRKLWVDMPFEHWFVEHTYHGDEFKDPEEFLKAKQASGLTLSVAVLTSNDSGRIHSVLTGLRRVLAELHPIADQIVVVDAGSSDGTPDLAREMGAEVYLASEILPDQGNLHGRGESWWKSLAVLSGNIVVWVDPRAKRFHPSTVLSLAGPLLRMPTLQMVKAFGHDGERRTKAARETPDGARSREQRRDDFSPVDMSWGGFIAPRRDADPSSVQVRVQALKPSDLESLSPAQIATLPPRTLFQVLCPSLAGVIAPFNHEMAARREAMMEMPVFTGDNLEVGLLLSVAARYGTHAIAQVELRQGQPSPPPQPGTRNAIDVLQVMARRLQDPAMRRHAAGIAERLQTELEGKRAPTSSGPFEVRALGPVERPPMRANLV